MNPLDELENLAKAAPPGPYHVEPWDGYEMKHQVVAPMMRKTTSGGQVENAELIVGRFSEDTSAALAAAISPDVVLALIAVARAAENYMDSDGEAVSTRASMRYALCDALAKLKEVR